MTTECSILSPSGQGSKPSQSGAPSQRLFIALLPISKVPPTWAPWILPGTHRPRGPVPKLPCDADNMVARKRVISLRDRLAFGLDLVGKVGFRLEKLAPQCARLQTDLTTRTTRATMKPTGRYVFGETKMPRQQRGEETRQHLLDVAETHFSRQGYDAARIAEICREAGVTKGAFYHHFASKQALFLELLNRWLVGLDVQLEAARTVEAGVSQALLRMAEMASSILEEAGDRLPILFEFWIQAARDPDIWGAAIDPYRRYRDFFADMICTGMEAGTLRRVDPELAAQMLVSLAVGLLLQGLLDPRGADWGRVMQDSVGMFIDSLTLDRQSW